MMSPAILLLIEDARLQQVRCWGCPSRKPPVGMMCLPGDGIGQVKIKGLVAQVELGAVRHQNIVLEPGIPADWKSDLLR